MDLKQGVDAVGTVVDIVGVAVIVVGFLVATLAVALAIVRTRDTAGRYRSYRQSLGRAILLGLELLVAADIIRTVAVAPTLESVLVLALIVLVRTFLSFSLEVELEGHWPWQRSALWSRSAAEQSEPAGDEA